MAAPVIEAPEIKLEGAEVTVTPELEAALDKAVSSAEIRQIILNEAAKQNITIPGDAKPRPAPEKKDEVKDTESELEDDEAIVYADDFVIGGKAYHFEGDSPADVNRQVKAAMAAHENAIHPEKKETPIAKKALTADEKVALQLDMQLGRITPEQYLEKTGFLDSYLESKGIKVDELKEVVREKKSTREVDAWKAATDAFLAKDGQDYPGGDQNTKVMGLKIAELGLGNTPSADSLQKAWDSMKAEKLVFPVETKTEPEEKVDAQPIKRKLSGSSVFGLGGGDAKKDKGDKTQTKVPTITDDMSGREIMYAFQQSALDQGLQPNDLVMQSQRR